TSVGFHPQTIPEETDSIKAPVTERYGGHKIVVSQWPYFRTMFASEMADGRSGNTDIHVKDSNASSFQKLLFFVYHGELDCPPTEILESDDPEKAQMASWGQIYLTALRHRIDDLRKQALDPILRHLDKLDAIAFLFRSAYLFEELRDSVVKHIFQDRHAEIVKKETKDKYKDHPELSELLGELFEAYRDLRNSQA
ncbi:hypothetical protein BG005_010808, partial [Podila minutissima]